MKPQKSWKNHTGRRVLEKGGVRKVSDSFDAAYNSLREDFLKACSNFKGFREDERYMVEREYKDQLISNYKQEICLRMESGDWESAGRALVKVCDDGRLKKMKLYSWDYGLLSDSLPKPDDQANFAREVANLTDESLPLERRIEKFLAFLEPQSLGYTKSGKQKVLSPAATRSIVSFFLTLNDPGKYFFLKSQLIKRIIKRFDPEFSWNKQHIQASEIEYMNKLAGRVSKRLSAEGWEPKDMFDVQFFFWEADKIAHPKADKIAHPKANKIAQLKPEDEKPAPPPREVHSKMDITTPSPREANLKIDIPENLILYGPPGTGKTWHTVDKAVEILDSDFYEANQSDRPELKRRFDELREEKRVGFVTFHQSFSYEDFVEGLRASTKDGQIHYKIEDGVFKTMCKAAHNQPDELRVLIIDEINRGNIANILGELITLIEPSKRAGTEEALTVTLPYSKEPFSVPANFYIVGTMNTADRSLVHIDTALRRRFEFEAMRPDAGLLQGIEIDGINIQKMLTAINSRIELLYDREHTLGHSFFLPLKENPDLGTLKRIFKNSIMPLLEEYFFEDWSRIRKVLGDDRKSGKELMFYVPAFSEDEIKGLLGEGDENNQGLSGKVFRRNEHALDKASAYIGIYEEPVGQAE